MQEEEEGLALELVGFFPSRSSIKLCINSSLLFAYLFMAKLIID
jgi:hypothetical protein